MGRLFRTDGVRGVANVQLTAELALGIGVATAAVLKERGIQRPRLLVGRDTRISGDMLEAAFLAGACSGGADVALAGIIPTPAVAYLTRTMGFDGGVVISASHNPIGDNGIKIFSSVGFKIADDVEERIEAYVLGDVEPLARPTGVDLGRAHPLEDAESRFVDFLVGLYPHRALSGLKVVLDCAHGAAWSVAPRVFHALGADAVVMNAEPDGARINVRCGSTDLGDLAERVRREGAHMGLGFDGDADRCLAVDEDGARVDGDQMLLAFSRDLHAAGRTPPCLVATVMSNLGLEHSLRDLGIEMRRAAVGDRFVLEEMVACGAMLGGEQSGHIIFLESSTTGDGVLTGTRLAFAVHRAGRALGELAQMPQVPQLLVNVRTPHKDRFDQDEVIMAELAAVEKTLRGRGRLLVRPSGTEPLLRIMAEGPDGEELQRLVGRLAEIVEHRLA